MMRPHIESKKGPKKQSLVGALKFDERKMTKNDDGKFLENWSFDRNRLWCHIGTVTSETTLS